MRQMIRWTFAEKRAIALEAWKAAKDLGIPVPFIRGGLKEAARYGMNALPPNRRRNIAPLPARQLQFIEDIILDEMTKPKVEKEEVVVHKAVTIPELESSIEKDLTDLVAKYLMDTPMFTSLVEKIKGKVLEEAQKAAFQVETVEEVRVQEQRTTAPKKEPPKKKSVQEVSVHSQKPRVLVLGMTPKQYAHTLEHVSHVQLENVENFKDVERHKNDISSAALVLLYTFFSKDARDLVMEYASDHRKVCYHNGSMSDVLRLIRLHYPETGERKQA